MIKKKRIHKYCRKCWERFQPITKTQLCCYECTSHKIKKKYDALGYQDENKIRKEAIPEEGRN